MSSTPTDGVARMAGSIHKRRGLLKDQLELKQVRVKGGQLRYTIKTIEDQLSFDKGFFVFIRAIQLLTTQNEGTIMIGFAGPSGSGKTAFSEKVKSFMPDLAVISMDNYNDGSKVVDGNFDDPRLTDYDLLLENIQDLKDGKDVQIPIYDFKQSKRVGYSELKVPCSRVVIIEGIYALSEKLRDLLDLKVSITGGVHLDLVKRVLRDLDRSGQDADEIITQISDTVYPMYKAFIEPDLKLAQLQIYNTFNPFTGFMNATYILKAQISISVGDAVSALGQTPESTTYSDIVDIYLLPPNEDPETCTSWLRMRNRDGRYSLMFEEWVTEDPFIISPRISFEVSVKILGGLMALGYVIGTVVERRTMRVANDDVVLKLDKIESLGTYVQLQGKDREKLREVGKALELEGNYVPRSYIELVQLEKLTKELRQKMDLKKHLGGYYDSFLSESSSPCDFRMPLASSLPSKLTGSASLPIPIKNFPNGIENRRDNVPGLSVKDGLLTRDMQEHQHQGAERATNNLFDSHASGLASGMQHLSQKLDLLTSKYEVPAKNLGKEVLELHQQCELLNRSLENLSEVMGNLVQCLDQRALRSRKREILQYVQIGLSGAVLGAFLLWTRKSNRS